jgi:hypothetical protein
VGANKPQYQLKICDSLSDGISAFAKAFKQKTANDWSDRAHFRSVKDKYTPVDLIATMDDEDEVIPCNILSSY